MNIVTQFPVNLNLNFANSHTEAARRDSAARELISQTEESASFAREKGLGNDAEKAANKQQPLTYDYIKAQHKERDKEKNAASDQEDATAEHENRGKQEHSPAEQKKIDKLEKRDQEVRAHEQAHANAGGQYAGTPSYDYERGPDGQSYAVGGEVKIDVSKVKDDPEATINKMQQVQRAALAPAEPSGQDRKVAAEAGQKIQQARSEMLKENAQELQSKGSSKHPENDSRIIKAKDIAEQGIDVKAVPIFEAKQSLNMEQETSSPSYSETLAQSDERINSRALKIQRHYHVNSLPRQSNLSQFA